MKSFIAIFIALLFVLVSYNSYSQDCWGRGSNYNRLYDVKTVETISGQVTSIDKVYPDKNSTYGTHLTVSTTSGSISIHLGPNWYIEKQDIQIATGDNITVTGSRVTYEGSQVIIAKYVTKGDMVLNLRDDEGYAFWSGWKNRNR